MDSFDYRSQYNAPSNQQHQQQHYGGRYDFNSFGGNDKYNQGPTNSQGSRQYVDSIQYGSNSNSHGGFNNSTHQQQNDDNKWNRSNYNSTKGSKQFDQDLNQYGSSNQGYAKDLNNKNTGGRPFNEFDGRRVGSSYQKDDTYYPGFSATEKNEKEREWNQNNPSAPQQDKSSHFNENESSAFDQSHLNYHKRHDLRGSIEYPRDNNNNNHYSHGYDNYSRDNNNNNHYSHGYDNFSRGNNNYSHGGGQSSLNNNMNNRSSYYDDSNQYGNQMNQRDIHRNHQDYQDKLERFFAQHDFSNGGFRENYDNRRRSTNFDQDYGRSSNMMNYGNNNSDHEYGRSSNYMNNNNRSSNNNRQRYMVDYGVLNGYGNNRFSGNDNFHDANHRENEDYHDDKRYSNWNSNAGRRGKQYTNDKEELDDLKRQHDEINRRIHELNVSSDGNHQSIQNNQIDSKQNNESSNTAAGSKQFDSTKPNQLESSTGNNLSSKNNDVNTGFNTKKDDFNSTISGFNTKNNNFNATTTGANTSNELKERTNINNTAETSTAQKLSTTNPDFSGKDSAIQPSQLGKYGVTANSDTKTGKENSTTLG